MKISNLPKTSKPKGADLITIVQGATTKVISFKDFMEAVNKSASKLSSEVKTLRADLFKRAIDKNNPVFVKSVRVPTPKNARDAATKAYVDKSAMHRVKTDGSSTIAAPLTYDKKFKFGPKDLVSKDYADALLDSTLKTIKYLNTSAYPKASVGDVFISNQAYKKFASNGPTLQKGDILICIENSPGGTHSSSASQFAIVNTNVEEATENVIGMVKFSTDEEVLNFSSDMSALTPKKYKDSLLASSSYNRKLVTTTTYAVTEIDKGILAVDNRRGSSVITLPNVAGLKEPGLFKLTVKDEFGQADVRAVTIKSAGSSIDGKSSIVLASKYQAVTIYNDGKDYYIENNTHTDGEMSENVLRAGVVYPSVNNVKESLYATDIDLSQFDVGQGFKVTTSGFFAANSNTKSVTIDVGGISTVANTTTTAPNSKSFVATVTILKEARYAVAYGSMLIDAVAADTYLTNGLNVDWGTSVVVDVTGNAATTNTDIQIYSFTVEPLK